MTFQISSKRERGGFFRVPAYGYEFHGLLFVLASQFLNTVVTPTTIVTKTDTEFGTKIQKQPETHECTLFKLKRFNLLIHFHYDKLD